MTASGFYRWVFDIEKPETVTVVGRRAMFLTTHKLGWLMDKKAFVSPFMPEAAFQVTVTFTIPEGRWAAAGHWCGPLGIGWGFLKQPRITVLKDGTKTMDYQTQNAELFLDTQGHGIFGWISRPVAGFCIAEIEEPEEGPAVILASGQVGEAPRVVPCFLRCGDDQGSAAWFLYTPENVLMDGSSGSPVLQVRGGKLRLVAVHRAGVEGCYTWGLAEPARALLYEARNSYRKGK